MEHSVEPYLASSSVVQKSVRGTRAAAKRRQRRELTRALPKPFCLYNKCTESLEGGMFVNLCHALPGDDAVARWTVARVAILALPVVVPMSSFRYMSNIFAVPKALEVQCRTEATLVGGTLNAHFTEYSTHAWKAWGIGRDVSERLRAFDGHAIRFNTPRNYCVAIGITPEVAADSSAVEEVQPLGVASEVVEEGGGDALADDSQLVGTAGTDDVRRSLDRMSVRQFGAIERRFTPEAILTCLDVAGDLKPGKSLAGTFGKVANLFFGRGNGLSVDLQRGAVPVPSLGLLRTSRVKLDYMDILFQRQLFLKFTYRRYWLVDSSPQLGYDFLCVREDRIRIPRCDDWTVELRALYDINAGFETRICPLSTLAHGKKPP